MRPSAGLPKTHMTKRGSNRYLYPHHRETREEPFGCRKPWNETPGLLGLRHRSELPVELWKHFMSFEESNKKPTVKIKSTKSQTVKIFLRLQLPEALATRLRLSVPLSGNTLCAPRVRMFVYMCLVRRPIKLTEYWCAFSNTSGCLPIGFLV